MSQPFVGEIRLFAGNFAPLGWMFCDGTLLLINEYETLFALIGTTYGGNGQDTFALPDLRGRVPVHQGPGLVPGQSQGSEAVTLSPAHLAGHDHTLFGSTGAAQAGVGPAGNVLASSATLAFYGNVDSLLPMSTRALSPAGGHQPHENMAPFQAVNFIISLFGIFPSPA